MGPVIITDRDRPAHVLLSFTDYKKLTNKPVLIADLLSMANADEIVFSPPRLPDLAQAADLR